MWYLLVEREYFILNHQPVGSQLDEFKRRMDSGYAFMAQFKVSSSKTSRLQVYFE
jgi:hypothetical protein